MVKFSIIAALLLFPLFGFMIAHSFTNAQADRTYLQFGGAYEMAAVGDASYEVAARE